MVCVFVLLAAVVRVYRLDTIQFDSDFGRDSLFGWRILQEKPTLLGAQASVGGFYLGPFYFYTIALLFALFGPLPLVLMLFFAALNILAAWLGYHFLSTRINRQAGMIFLLLFAAHPLLAEASRMATHAPMLPFITVLSMFLLVRSLEKPTARTQLLSGLSLGLFLHVHFSSLLLFPGYFLILTIGTKGPWKHKVRALLIHSVGCAIMLFPLLVFDLRHQFITSKAFASYIFSIVRGESVREGLPHWSASEKLSQLGLYISKAQGLQVVGIIGALFGCLVAVRQQKNQKIALILGFLLSTVSLLLLGYSGYLFPYYFIVPGTLLLLTFSALISHLPLFSWAGVAFILFVYNLTLLPHVYAPQFRTELNLLRITSAIAMHQQKHPQPFSIYKDSSDKLTGLGYEYRFLLTRDGFTPVSENSYDQARVLYLIREEGNGDPLTLGGHELSQFKATKSELIQTIQIQDRTIDLFVLSK